MLPGQMTKVRKDMKNTFTTYALCSEGNAGSRLSIIDAGFSSQPDFSPQTSEYPLLTGGFPSLTAETSFPLSPTLQLNGDLGDLSLQELERLAKAELERLNRITFRSYTVESDPRICVLAEDGGSLKNFIETYGGVLDIHALLLKNEHPEFPRVFDLAISRAKAGYELAYSVRVPIDRERCTYCGLCGPVCPVGCISEDLSVDFTLCTFCRDCETICPPKAIDIYGAQTRHLQSPALLLLDDIRLDIPDNGPPVYSQQTLPSFFATLFPSRIDEVITCDHRICQYSGRLAVGCSLCHEACIHGAIDRGDKGIEVDAFRCMECGACVSVCPTGALQYQRFPDGVFREYCRNLPLKSGSTVVLGSESSLHTLWWQRKLPTSAKLFFVEYPNVRALSLWHLLSLFTSGARRIILLDHAGEGTWLDQQARRIYQANVILEALFGLSDAVLVSTLQDLDSHLVGGTPYPLAKCFFPQGFGNRRVQLKALLEFLMQQSGRQPQLPADDTHCFTRLICDAERCTGCLACLNECRIGALSTNESELILQHHGAMCVGCGICVRVCPEDVLSLTTGALLNDAFFQPVVLSQAEPIACRKCGKVFGTRKSFNRVMAILSHRETIDTEHFEFCDVCRVENLFSAQPNE